MQIQMSNPKKTLSNKSLNRTLLARQWLFTRQERTATEAIEHLIGLQAQNTEPPYLGLWSRLAGFALDDLSGLLLDRSVVRLSLMRSTIHLVTARDCLRLRPLLQPVQERNLYSASPYGRNILGMDMEALLWVGRDLVEEEPRTLSELAALLHARWPDRDGVSMAYGIRNLVPLVQLPPRGVWGRGGQAVCTSAEKYLGKPLEQNASLDALILRYLRAFGPASVKDIQTWSGLTRLQATMDTLRPHLRVFYNEQNQELFDVPDGDIIDPETPAPPRFLGEYDNLMLSHFDRSRIVTEEDRKRLSVANGYKAFFLLNGFARGTWKIAMQGQHATLQLSPPTDLSPKDRQALQEEGERLLTFMRPESTARSIQFV